MWKVFFVCPIAATIFAIIRRFYEKKLRPKQGYQILEWNLSTKLAIVYGMMPLLIVSGPVALYVRGAELSALDKKFFIYISAGWFTGALVLILEKRFR